MGLTLDPTPTPGLSQGGPAKLRGATAGWAASGWDDAAIATEVGGSAVNMLVMPTETHPTLDAEHGALTEPALSGVFVSDFLTLTRPSSKQRSFSAYLAQMNLLALPRLLRQICLPTALPAATLQMANVWVGGELMKNGLHYDNYDNLLHQIRGRKRALIFPPKDTPHLYYGAASIHRHEFDLPGGVSNQTTFEKVPPSPLPSPPPPITLIFTLIFTLPLTSSTVIASHLASSRLTSSHLVFNRSVTTWPWSTSSLTTSAPPTRWCDRPLPWSASWTRATPSSCPAGGAAWAEGWGIIMGRAPLLAAQPTRQPVALKACRRAQGYLLGRRGAPLPAWAPTRGCGGALMPAPKSPISPPLAHPGGITP